MLYQIRFEANGTEGKRMVRAFSDEEAMRAFRESYELYGDEFTGSCWVEERWSEQ